MFHVALTRAGRQVVVLADEGSPSTFLAELDGSAPHAASSFPVAEPGRARIGVSVVVPCPPRPAAAPGPAGAQEAALRAWRSSVARKDGVPAYVVLNDKELVGIAERNPGSLAELGRCRGMGPIRLERWGDEILAVLDGAGGSRAPDGGSGAPAALRGRGPYGGWRHPVHRQEHLWNSASTSPTSPFRGDRPPSARYCRTRRWPQRPRAARPSR